MITFNEAFDPRNSHKAPKDFADRVMQRIYTEQTGMYGSLAFGRRAAGIAAMFLMCVSLGIAIGSNASPGFLTRLGTSSIQEFQDMHHLSGAQDTTPLPLFKQERK